MDEQEDTSVTFAIVNLLCELAPTHANEIIFLAQRLFELLVDGHHNWMAIRILKLVRVILGILKRLADDGLSSPFLYPLRDD